MATNNQQTGKGKFSIFSSSNRKDPSFNDIEDAYFTIKTINKKKEHCGMEPYFEDDASSACSDIVPKDEITKIYNLLKHQSKDEFDPEESKVDILEQLNLEDNSDENDNENKNQENVDQKLKENVISSNEKLNNERLNNDVKDELLNPIANSLDNNSRESTTVDTNTNLLAFMIEEDHFVAVGGQDNAAINTSKNAEEIKADNSIKIKFEDVIIDDVDQSGMTPRTERVSNIVQEVTIDDFDMIKFLGDGSYGKVNLVKCRINNAEYALKILDKNKVAKYGKIANVMREKDIMFDFDHPNITRLEMTFQDQASLFFLLEYAPNGSLAGLIKREKRLELELIRFYAWEIINALENMRIHKVVHRDLKPENILLDDKYHLKISDFGDAKVIDPVSVHK